MRAPFLIAAGRNDFALHGAGFLFGCEISVGVLASLLSQPHERLAERREDARRSNSSRSASLRQGRVQRSCDEFKRQAGPTVAKTGLPALQGCDWRGKRERRHNELGKHRPTKHLPNRSTRVRDRHPTSKRNSGGSVIFGWNCALQDVTSQASHISALRLIANEAEVLPPPPRRHARSPCGRPILDQNRPDGR